MVHEYSLQIGGGRRGGRGTRVAARLILDRDVWAGREETQARLGLLRGLVAARNAERRDSALPDDFPMFVSPITSVHAVDRHPDVVDIRLDTSGFGLRPDKRDALVREFCGAVAEFLIQGPGQFPPPLSPPAPAPAPPAQG